MVNKTMAMLTILFFLIVIGSPLLSAIDNASSQSKIPAVFAFGDSTIDSGNNNGLNTVFRSDHPPYGRDFPPANTPSGRFSDGKLTTDYLVGNLGIKQLLPAYLDPTLSDQDLLTGASFASAGSGLDDTTTAADGVLSMAVQLRYFDQAMQRMERAVGKNRTDQIVREALFVISVGTNDVVFNLYGVNEVLGGLGLNLFRNPSSNTPSTYQDFLLQRLGSFIQALYARGARKFGVAGLPPVGCLPLQVTVDSLLPSAHMWQRVCVQHQNKDSEDYNSKLQTLLSQLTTSLPDTKFVYFGIYDVMKDMIINPNKYGFQQTVQGCCGTGTFEMGPLCIVGLPMCQDASKFLFWDSIHPTQAAYLAISNEFLQSVLQLN